MPKMLVSTKRPGGIGFQHADLKVETNAAITNATVQRPELTFDT